ncbi:MAG: tripartite tricarboxylate transporter substrate-binding protein [Xanthobacteraceae bacterium]
MPRPFAAVPACAALAALAFAIATPGAAQGTYPNRSLLLTHGFGAGGNGDVVSRIVGEAISPRLGQPVVIEPRPGAGGNNASARLVKSDPDGYTLITLTGGHAVSAAIYKSLPFHPVDDFQFVSVYGYQAFMIGVKKGNAIKSIADLIAAAKAAPGKLTYSSVGIGSTQHLAGELFCAMAGVKMTHVPYRGGNAPMTDLLGGQIDVSFDTITVIEPQVRAGTVQALGVTSGTKWWSLPDITPVAATVPGYDVRTWLGMAAPKGTPAAVVARLNAAMREGLTDKAVDARLRRVGMDVRPSSPEEMRTMVASQIANWKKVVADAKIPQQ